MSHIFLSYSSKDGAYAKQIAARLRAEGFDVWIDKAKLRRSEDWWRSIVLALRECAAMVVILTPDSDRSKWVQREITLAEKYDKPIFPLWRAGEIDTPNWEIFVRTQFEDVRNGNLPSDAFFADLGEVALKREGHSADVMPPVPAPKPAPRRSRVYDILPAPFEWIEIPAGKVTLVNDWMAIKESISRKVNHKPSTCPHSPSPNTR